MQVLSSVGNEHDSTLRAYPDALEGLVRYALSPIIKLMLDLDKIIRPPTYGLASSKCDNIVAKRYFCGKAFRVRGMEWCSRASGSRGKCADSAA